LSALYRERGSRWRGGATPARVSEERSLSPGVRELSAPAVCPSYAQREIFHQDALGKAHSREEVGKLEAELARDRDRLASDRDRKIAKIKQRSAT
jgi:hypothetical protein